jgi:hypothetical protein
MTEESDKQLEDLNLKKEQNIASKKKGRYEG